MRLNLLASVLVICGILLTACETMTSSRQVAINTTEKWALLPIKNLSKTPLAGDRARALVETHLRARGVKKLELYEVTTEQSLLTLLDDASQLNAAKQWAIDNGIRFAVTGNVQEWQYKNGLDNEPSIGMTLKFLDLHNDSVLWLASASRTGWGYSNLSSVASKTIDDLLAEVRFSRPRKKSTRVLARLKPGRIRNMGELPPSPQASVSKPLRTLPLDVEPATAAALPAEVNRPSQHERNLGEHSDR